MKEHAYDALVRDISLGIIIGTGLLIYLVIMAAISDRRPPDKKDGE